MKTECLVSAARDLREKLIARRANFYDKDTTEAAIDALSDFVYAHTVNAEEFLDVDTAVLEKATTPLRRERIKCYKALVGRRFMLCGRGIAHEYDRHDLENKLVHHCPVSFFRVEKITVRGVVVQKTRDKMEKHVFAKCSDGVFRPIGNFKFRSIEVDDEGKKMRYESSWRQIYDDFLASAPSLSTNTNTRARVKRARKNLI